MGTVNKNKKPIDPSSQIPMNVQKMINSDQGADPNDIAGVGESADPNVANATGTMPNAPPPVSSTNSNTVNDTNADFDTTMPGDDSSLASSSIPAGLSAAINPKAASTTTKPTSPLQKGLGTIAAIAAGVGVAGRNKTGAENLQKSNELTMEATANRARVAQTQAATAEQQQETARKGAVYGAQPALTYEQQLALQRKSAPVTEEQDITGKKYKVVPNETGGASAVPIPVQGAVGANTTLQGDPSKIDPFTTAMNAFVATNKRMPNDDEMTKIVESTSPRYITGAATNASKERIATQTNQTRMQQAQESTRRALGAAQIHWNAAKEMFANGQFTKYDLENSQGDIALMKQIAANVGKDYSQNPKMRALGIVDDSTAEDAMSQLVSRLDARANLGKARISQSNNQYKQTAVGNGTNGFKKGARYGSNDGKTWTEIKQQ